MPTLRRHDLVVVQSLLIGLFLFAGEVRDGFRILNRIVDERHILVFGLHIRRSFVVALMRLVFHWFVAPPLRVVSPVCPGTF